MAIFLCHIIVPLKIYAVGIATSPSRELNLLVSLPLPSLIEKARGYYDTNPDSALIYYTAISNRYSPSMTDENRKICLEATLERWEIVFFNYFDYSTAFDCLSKANEICEGLKYEHPRIALYYGCMYHTVFEQAADTIAGEKAFDFFANAFHKAAQVSDMHTCRLAFGNLVEIAHSLGRIDQIKPDADLFRTISNQGKWIGRDFDLGLYDALCSDARGEYKNSAEEYTRLIEIAESLGHARYMYAAVNGLIGALMKSHQYDRALTLIQQADSVFSSMGILDGKLILRRKKADCYDRMGMTDSARIYMYDYIMLKDSLLSYNQAVAIKTNEFMDDIRDFDRKLTDAQIKRQRLLASLAVATIIAAIIAIAGLKLRSKNRALEKANKSLYHKNQELLNQELIASRLRDKNAAEVYSTQHRYKGNTVTDDMRDSLWSRILDIMDHSDEIYDTDFSLDRLAELCDSKPKYVSQVINEKGDNFKTILNKYRVHKACRSLTPGSNLTIEAVANNVGFRSVNAFRASFRRVTGLTPSDYIRMAKLEIASDSAENG